jgi:hypothetical protein
MRNSLIVTLFLAIGASAYSGQIRREQGGWFVEDGTVIYGCNYRHTGEDWCQKNDLGKCELHPFATTLFACGDGDMNQCSGLCSLGGRFGRSQGWWKQ